MSTRGAAGSPTTPVAPAPAAPAGARPAPRAESPGAPDPPANGPAPVTAGEEFRELSAQRDAPVGGQAVLEGGMMRGVSHWAVAVRKPSAEQLEEGERDAEEPALGEIEVSTFPLTSVLKRHRLLRLPILRGVVALGE